MMLNYLMQRRLNRCGGESREITLGEVEQARKVLFALFSRYGDVVIGLSVIKEFMAKYPDKQYFLITSNQMYPYARKLLGERATILSFNKRRNPIRLMQIVARLKREKIDLGFNPWSSGTEAKFISSYANRFHFYTNFRGISNIYDRIRDYLSLPAGERVLPAWNLDRVHRLVICPRSTVAAKSLDQPDLRKLVAQVREKFPGAVITIALAPSDAPLAQGLGEIFLFRKSKSASQAFLNLLSEADLVISVDAGPLHLADKLGLRTIGIFGPTTPLSVLDRATGVAALRDRSLAGYYCGVKCREPRCLHRLFQGDFLDHRDADYPELEGEVWEMEQCPLG
jgi:ADP-heptose:LPS heptosyltransferase